MYTNTKISLTPVSTISKIINNSQYSTDTLIFYSATSTNPLTAILTITIIITTVIICTIKWINVGKLIVLRLLMCIVTGLSW